MKRLLLPAALLLFATACASTSPPPQKNAEYYLQEGERLLENEQYEAAIESWEKVREAFYSPELSVLAELKIAESHFLAKNYVEAAVAYGDFLKAYPDHPRTAEVLYMLGMSFYKQILSADRDQTATHNALITFENLLKRFPDDPNSGEARVLVAQCRDRLAAHELYVGHFYLRTGKYQPAISRLQEIPETYPDFSGLDQVYFYLGQAHQKNGNRLQSLEAFDTLVRNFPQSQYTRDAHKFLKSND